jgi:uncharacterized repeat protein (TIGR03803 family)
MRFFGAIILFLAALLTQPENGHASTMNILYSFCSVPTYCQDGASPNGSLLPDGAGGFYATVSSSTPNGGGGVVHLTDTAGIWSVEVIYSFCAKPDCSEGSSPNAGVIQDVAGNLYGVTDYHGTNNAGTVFELIPNAGRTKWKLKVLYRFCSLANCTDGLSPTGLAYAGQLSGALYDGVSPLFGTTASGGTNGGGITFSLTPKGHNWKFKNLHDFSDPNSIGDGSGPSRLMADSTGNLFVATRNAGAHRWGAIVELSPNDKGKFKERVIYSFCSEAGCSDGATPYAPLTEDAGGNLFGTTGGFGANNAGTIFKLSPGGEQYNLTTLYSFCSKADCADGYASVGQLTLDANGNIFGTTVVGGDPDNSGGVVFEMNPSYHVLYTFCSQSPPCKDGENPRDALFIDGQNHAFGLTYNGGAHNSGELFEISP